MSKTNGSGKDEKPKEKIISFPSLAERDRLRREKLEQEKQWQAEYKQSQKAANPPFLNIGKIPVFTRILVISLLVINAPLLLDSGTHLWAIYNFGFIPANFTDPAADAPPWALFTSVTHLFIHGGWMHLIFNVAMGLALTMFIETRLGTRRAILFFFICGIAGALCYFLINPYTTTPVVGASGGISGYFAAAIIMMQRQSGMRQFGKLSKYGPWPMVAFWVILLTLIGMIGGDIAWQAHVGGFIAGAGLLVLLKKNKIRL